MQEARSHLASRKEQAKKMKAVVIQLLKWDELEYAMFQYESGLAYLRFYIPWDKEGQRMLEESELFWNWWKNQWLLRDEDFCGLYKQILLDKYGVENLRRTYLRMNDAEYLASEIYPNKAVLDESYNQMIHQLHKEVLHG